MKAADALRQIMAGGQWWPLHTLHAELERLTGKKLAETNTAARIRDLRKPEHGALQIESRKREGSTGWEYRWAKADRPAAETPQDRETVRKAEVRAVFDTANANLREARRRVENRSPQG